MAVFSSDTLIKGDTGLTWSDSILTASGNIIANSISTEWSSGRTGNTRILSPGGGSYSYDETNDSGHITGAIIITLPQGGSNTMLSMTVKIFDYSKNEHITLNIAGYALAVSQDYPGAWRHPSAWVEGNPKDNHNYNVRFTYDLEKDKNVIIIGEKNSRWTYPDVNIIDVQVGYDASSPDKWNDGWEIELSEDWDTLNHEGSPRYPDGGTPNGIVQNTQTHNWIRNTDHSIDYRSGNVNITGGSLTIGDYTFPAAKGGAGQVLKTDANGNVTWQNDIVGDFDTNYYTDSAELDNGNLLTFTRVGDSGTYSVDLSSLKTDTNFYTDSAQLDGNTLKFSRTDDADAYSVDLSSLKTESIWTKASDTATYDGHIVVDSLSTNWQNPIYGARSNTRVLNPKGGSFSNEISSNPETRKSDGSIIITLPQGKSSTMLSMTVKIFDYSLHEHLILNVSGYIYDNNSHNWTRGSVWIDNNPKYSHNLTVWLGYDAELEKNVVIIGEPDTTWGSFLDVNVMDVQAQHHNEEVGKWNDGWDIELSEDWETQKYGVTQWSPGSKKYITTNNTTSESASKFINTQTNNWYRSDDDTVEYDDGAIAKSFITKGPSNKRILSPEGATFYSDSSDVEGAFIIELPHDNSWATNAHTNGPWTDTHISLTVKIYDYWSDEHITLNISGYNYHGGTHDLEPISDPSNGYWARTSAWIEGNPKDEHNFTVRFAYDKGFNSFDDGKCVIIIGEKDSKWDRPKLYITDLQVAGSNSDQSWHKGWNVTFSDDWEDLTIPILGTPAWEGAPTTEARYVVKDSSTIENTQAHNWVRNGDNIEYSRGTVKINDYTLPAEDGTDGQVLKTNGSGTTSWQDTGSGLSFNTIITLDSSGKAYPAKNSFNVIDLKQTLSAGKIYLPVIDATDNGVEVVVKLMRDLTAFAVYPNAGSKIDNGATDDPIEDMSNGDSITFYAGGGKWWIKSRYLKRVATTERPNWQQ